MDSPTDITVILVSYNTAALLPEVLHALDKASSGCTLQIIIVDNNSKDGSVALLRRDFPKCELIVNSINVGFGRANNQALERVKGRYVLLLNTDAFVSTDTIRKTMSYMDSHERCGILGVRLIGRDGTAQPSARNFPTPWNVFLQRTGLNRLFPHVRLIDDKNWDHASVKPCDWVPGCYYLVRKAVIDQIGLFDPRFFLYCEEVDHCYTAKKMGWEVVCLADTTVVHIGGESAKSEGQISRSGRQLEALRIESELLFFRKNYGFVPAVAGLVLSIAAEVILVMKRALTLRFPLGLLHCWNHARISLLLCMRTRLGVQPTR